MGADREGTAVRRRRRAQGSLVVRLGRVLELLFLIGAGNRGTGWTSRRLASHFGVSSRRIFQDLEVLRHLGVHLVNDGSGYRLASPISSLPVPLRPEEILALVRPDRDCRAVRERAQAKLAQGLPEPWRRLVFADRRLRVLEGPSPVGDRIWRPVEESLAGRRLLRLWYRGHRDGGQAVERWVEPHALFWKGTGWYLAAWCRTREDWRLFRLDRVEEASVGGPFEERAGFDVEAYLGTDLGVWVGRALGAEVEVLPSHVEAVGSEARALGLPFRTRRGGGGFLEIPRGHLDEAAWWLARFGEGVRVVHPPELRERLVKVARRILELHGVPSRERV